MAQILIDPQLYTAAVRQQAVTDIYRDCQMKGKCLLWTKSGNDSGYPRKSFLIIKRDGSRSRKTVLVYRLLYAFMHNMAVGGEETNGKDVSHICHNRACLYLLHLCLEPKAVNTSRRSCVVEGKCKGEHNLGGIQYPNCVM